MKQIIEIDNSEDFPTVSGMKRYNVYSAEFKMLLKLLTLTSVLLPWLSGSVALSIQRPSYIHYLQKVDSS